MFSFLIESRVKNESYQELVDRKLEGEVPSFIATWNIWLISLEGLPFSERKYRGSGLEEQRGGGEELGGEEGENIYEREIKRRA